MQTIPTITRHFPHLTEVQAQQFEQLMPLYSEWNERINVISRKDIEHLYTHHVLHSLAIAKVLTFTDDSQILDLGTGGGFPGIPLAILFPFVNFTLVDSIGKKMNVVREVVQALGLTNVTAIHGRAEALPAAQFDFVVTRAVAPMQVLATWTHKLFSAKQRNAMPNGLLALKGGNIKSEVKALGHDAKYVDTYKVTDLLPREPYFEEKYVVYYPS